MPEVAPMNQEQYDIEANWKMPDVCIGDVIVWLSRWNDPTSISCARVTRVSIRSIECRVDSGPNSTYQIDVLHCNDPRLVRNVNMQRNGSWDYSSMEKRLRRLEADLYGTKKDEPAPGDGPTCSVSVKRPEAENPGASLARLKAHQARTAADKRETISQAE